MLYLAANICKGETEDLEFIQIELTTTMSENDMIYIPEGMLTTKG